ncbi:MAG: anaerobic ribonucleoside-triphosphate reductase activating protein [Peptococcaceae bacterium]|jgi:pyruvate formate lyase activating enzyme|nr:anaerobic ribonucleoside-triphosphate reductase activating protein [Peptococcaceae bacterium]
MIVALEPFSMVDYPGHIVATVFFGGCNFRCGYCHNPALVDIKEKSQTSPSNIQGVIDFLQTRKGLLDGVCLTGGEPLLSSELLPLVKKIKEIKRERENKAEFKIKLDTNGSNLAKLQEVAPYLDYIAMDIKAIPEKYAELTGLKNSWEKVVGTIEWIKESNIPYEFRTTVLPVWHTFEDLESIRKYLGLDTNWILQQFRQPPDGVLDRKEYEAYPDAWLKEIGEKLNCKVRGLH